VIRTSLNIPAHRGQADSITPISTKRPSENAGSISFGVGRIQWYWRTKLFLFSNPGSYSTASQSTRDVTDNIVYSEIMVLSYTKELEIRICPAALLEFLLKRPHSRSRRVWHCCRSRSKLQVFQTTLLAVGLGISWITSAP